MSTSSFAASSWCLAAGMFLAVSDAQEPGPPGPAGAPAPDHAVARVNGQELPFQQFEEWLVHAHGWRHLDDFVDLALLRQEATRLQIALPTAADLDLEFERDWKVRVEMRGDEAALLAELARAGIDKSSQRDRQLGTIEQDFLGRRILALRDPDESTLKELFAKEFGKEGARNHVRVAFFDRLKGLKGTASKEAVKGLADTARQRAQAFYDAVKADRTRFAALVAESDRLLVDRFDAMPFDPRKEGGEIARLHADWFGGALEKPLQEAKAGDLLGPIEAPAGCFVVEVVARGPVTYADVETELRAVWKARTPSGGELFWLKDELHKKAKIEKLGLNPPSH
jgi:hypothetical protein